MKQKDDVTSCTFRISKAVWDEFAKTAQSMDTKRTYLLIEFIEKLNNEKK